MTSRRSVLKSLVGLCLAPLGIKPVGQHAGEIQEVASVPDAPETARSVPHIDMQWRPVQVKSEPWDNWHWTTTVSGTSELVVGNTMVHVAVNDFVHSFGSICL